MARAAAAWLLVLLAACDEGPAAGPAMVDPAECEFGRHFAECGDDADADPVFACAGERCRWYSGGAVADDVTEVSRCPPDDVCCEAGFPDRGWPFPIVNGVEPNRAAYWLFYGLDQLPWDRERAMALAVTVDATVLGAEPPTFACTGAVVEQGLGAWSPCDGVTVVIAERAATLVLISPPSSGAFGWFPQIEIAETEDGLQARLCAHRFTDYTLGSCPYARTADCATSGALQLSRWPESDADVSGISFRVHAVFDDSVEVDASGVL